MNSEQLGCANNTQSQSTVMSETAGTVTEWKLPFANKGPSHQMLVSREGKPSAEIEQKVVYTCTCYDHTFCLVFPMQNILEKSTAGGLE